MAVAFLRLASMAIGSACDLLYPGLAAFARIGRLAQLVEHLVYTERVSGSSPLPPTTLKYLEKNQRKDC
jgi:hypothetical protein